MLDRLGEACQGKLAERFTQSSLADHIFENSPAKGYRQFTEPVHVNPNPKNFNDHDKPPTTYLLNIKFKHSAYN